MGLSTIAQRNELLWLRRWDFLTSPVGLQLPLGAIIQSLRSTRTRGSLIREFFSHSRGKQLMATPSTPLPDIQALRVLRLEGINSNPINSVTVTALPP